MYFNTRAQHQAAARAYQAARGTGARGKIVAARSVGRRASGIPSHGVVVG
jgi:hypothetical protein